MERTYIMTKPDAYQRGLIGEIITRIEKKNFKITDMKMMNLTEEVLREHYAHIADKPFFPEILEYMTSAPVVGMVVEGNGVVDLMRKLMGPTDSLEAEAGTIRGDLANSKGENIIHGSNLVENAEIEIKRFFG
ncbi:MAG: nucleoside-diphosphate kinase [Bacilli bacterium]